jgi:hypothetical protein
MLLCSLHHSMNRNDTNTNTNGYDDSRDRCSRPRNVQNTIDVARRITPGHNMSLRLDALGGYSFRTGLFNHRR